MAFGDVVVRVRSKIGISRLCFTKNSTFGDLKKELRNRINFSDGSVVKLFVEGSNVEIHGSDDVLLKDLGINHGTSLFLDQSSSDLSYTKIKSVPKSKDFGDEMEMDVTEDPTQQMSSRSYATDSSNSKDEDSEKKETDGPLFKSFDSYLHENGFSIGDLPLKNSYLPVRIKKGAVNKLPLGVTIRHQKYRHVDHLEMMNVDEVRSFANYWMADLEMSFQRIGWMYGYYTEDNHYPYGIRAVCEAIYEPPQLSQINDVALLDDNLLINVDKIANRLGLERIGIIFTRLPNECFLTAKELMRSIEMQYNSLKCVHYTGYPISTMVTCTMSPDESGQPVLNAFMASDLALAFYRDELLQNNQDHDNLIKFRESEDSKEIMPLIIESGKEVTKFDTSWLMVRINESAPIKPNSFFNSNTHSNKFPVENRSYTNVVTSGGSSGGSVSSNNNYNNNNSGSSYGYGYGNNQYNNSTNSSDILNSSRITNKQGFKILDKKVLVDYFNGNGGNNPWNDFHLLIYVCQALDVDTALAICDSIVKGEQVDELVKDLLIQP